MAQKSSSLTFSHWKVLCASTWKAFPRLWWRIAAVNVCTILTLLVGTGILGGIGYLAFRETIETVVANIMMGGDIGQVAKLVPVILLLAIWILFVLVFSLNGKTGSFLTVKNYLAKKEQSPFRVYFVESWTYFWRYVSLIIRSLWYVLWPVAFVGGLVILVQKFITTSEVAPVAGILLGAVLLVWRLVRLAFMRETLICFNQSAPRSFAAALKISKGNWWGIFLFILLFFLVLSAGRGILLLPTFFPMSPEWLTITSQIVDFLFSFFILAPLLITFLYFLMLHLSKLKNVKP